MFPLNNISSWRSYFYDIGLNEDVIDRHINYIAPLLKKSIPVIFDRDHLCLLLGVSVQYISNVLNSSHGNYRKFRIPKRSGGFREIVAPRPPLKKIQRWVLDNILSKIKVHKSANGFVRNRSTQDHCAPHVGARTLAKFDFKDFFPSISKSRVICLFRSIGYSDEVSLYLASICCLNNSLPQGGVTSPAVSNLICRRLDKRFHSLAKSKGWTYTRYADDLVFSGVGVRYGFSAIVKRIAADEGFSLNESKTRVYSGDRGPCVTGLIIGKDSLGVPRSFKRESVLQAHYVIKHGVLSHSAVTRSRNPYLVSSLIGRFNYWLSVEPNNERAAFYLNNLIDLRDS